MKVVYGIKNLKVQHPTVVTIGVFDGVHIGHKRIIDELLKQAVLLRATPCVVTFHPHPDKILKRSSSIEMLTSLQHRLSLLQGLGVELCVIINFTRKIAQQSASGFIKRLLLDKLCMRALVAGKDFSFGADRVQILGRFRKIAKELNFKLIVVKPKRHHSHIISSSLIRHLIERGCLNTAKELLGRPVSILGRVVIGRRRGRIIGFKTANIEPHHEAIPPSGVYAVYAKFGKRLYEAVLNIGTRPTFNEKEPTIEVHIFGINRNLYGKDIEVYFKKRLRQERRFKYKDHLYKQILKDARIAKRLL